MATPKPYQVERKGETVVVSLGWNRRFVVPCRDADLLTKRIQKACKEARRYLSSGWLGKMNRATNERVGWVERSKTEAAFYLYLGKGKVLTFALEEEAHLIEQIRDCAGIKQTIGFTKRILGWFKGAMRLN
ncbi:MAG: hypothetical protein H6727_09280 [Myxococcales bacterium]|nr:hypothetical protein [Myxococcales bacterium]